MEGEPGALVLTVLSAMRKQRLSCSPHPGLAARSDPPRLQDPVLSAGIPETTVSPGPGPGLMLRLNRKFWRASL